MKRKPDPRQKEMNFTRGEQLALLRAIRELPANERHVLRVLDDHIGEQRSWTMTVQQIVDETGYSDAGTRNFLERLKERGLIFWEEIGQRYHDGRREWFICWPNIAEWVETPHGEMISHPVGQWSTPCNDIPHGGIMVHTVGSHIRNSAPPSAISNAPSAPPPPAATENAELVVMVANCEVGRPGECIEQALAHGLTAEQITAVVAHYRDPANQGRWSPGVLFNRLTRSGAFALAPDAGWFGDSPEWVSRQRQKPTETPAVSQEARHGPTLDQLSSDELRALAEEMPPRDRDFALRAISAGHATQLPEARRLFLRQLACTQPTGGGVPCSS